MIFIGRLRVRLLGCLGQQRNGPGAPDGARQLALMPRATPRDAAGSDLAPFGHEPLEAPYVLEVDQAQLVHAELADLAAPEPAPLDGLACWWNGRLLLA